VLAGAHSLDGKTLKITPIQSEPLTKIEEIPKVVGGSSQKAATDHFEGAPKSDARRSRALSRRR